MSLIETAGIVLAGGRSSRFGSDKMFATAGSQTILERVLGEVGRIVDEIFLSVADVSPSYPVPVSRQIPDIVAGIGPIGGLHAAMDGIDADRYLVVAGDLPFIGDDDLRRLISTAGEPAFEAVIARDADGHLHPLTAVYRRSILPLVVRRVESGEYAMNDLISLIPNVSYVTLPADSLTNINRPGDLTQRGLA